MFIRREWREYRVLFAVELRTTTRGYYYVYYDNRVCNDQRQLEQFARTISFLFFEYYYENALTKDLIRGESIGQYAWTK